MKVKDLIAVLTAKDPDADVVLAPWDDQAPCDAIEVISDPEMVEFVAGPPQSSQSRVVITASIVSGL